MRTLRGYPATMTAQWCSQGPSGITKADADAKSVMKEAVYMILFRCFVLLTQAEGMAARLCAASHSYSRALKRVASHRYKLYARFWQGEVPGSDC